MKKLFSVSVLILFTLSINSQSLNELEKLRTTPKSDVFLQGFYWNSNPGGIWWDSLKSLAPRLASAGFSAVWIPPAAKGGGGFSMGYDIYDNYDFGEYNQKGSTETRFGSKSEMLQMIEMKCLQNPTQKRKESLDFQIVAHWISWNAQRLPDWGLGFRV